MALLTVRQVQEELAVSRACVYALIEAGQLPCIRIGVGRGTIRIDQSDLEAFVRERRKPHRTKKKRKLTGSGFVHLDPDRLRQAWQQDD